MPNLDVIRNLTVRATATGVAETTAALNTLAGAQGRVASSAQGMATVTDMSSRRTLSAAQALERLAAKHDDAYRAAQQHQRGMALLERATAQGLAGTREFAIAQAALNKLHHESAGAHAESAAAAGLNRMQMMELGHVAKSVFDEIAAGQSPLRALQVEGGRIAQIFTEGQGGVGGTLKAVGGIVGRLATGWVGLSVGLGGAALVAGAVALSYSNAQERMQRALEGTGRAAGMTVAQLDAVAKAGARQANISVPEARSIAGDMAQAGLSGPLSQSLIGSTARFARFTGQENGEAGRSLAEAFKDPVQGAASLDRSLGFLNDRLAQTIRDYEESGQHQRAQIELQEAYQAALKATTDSTWLLGDAMREAKRFGGSLVDSGVAAVNHLLGGDLSIDDKLKFYREKLPNTYDSPLAFGTSNRGYVQDQIKRLEEEQAKRVDPAAQARDAEANRLSLQVGPLVRQILPEIARATRSENEVGLLRQALADPAILAKLGGGVGQSDVEAALRRSAVTASYADPTRRMMQDYDLAKQSADAFSLAERAAVDARRAELAVLRETGDVSRAATAAEIARNEAIAKANEEARQALETARQNANLVGLTPYERGRQEIVNRYEGFGGLIEKASASKSELNDAMRPVADDLHRAGETIAEAMREAAKTIAGAASPFGALDRNAFPAVGGALPTFAAGAKAFDAAPASIQAMIRDASARTGVDPGILAAIGQKENGYRLTGATGILGPNGRPASSAYGYGQLTDGAASDVARVMPGFSKFDPNTAVLGAAAYFKILQGRFGDTTTALDHYGTGPGYGADILRRAGGAGAPLTIHRGTAMLPTVDVAAGRPVNDNTVAPIAATAAGSYTKAEGFDLAAYDKEHLIAPLVEAKNALEQQRGALASQAAGFGLSASRAAELAKQQELLNTYTRDHIPVTADTRAGIDLLAKSYGDLAQAQQDAQQRQRDLVAALDDFRDVSKGALSSFVGDMLAGKSATEGLRDALKGIESKLAGKLEDTLVDSLFGRSGSFGGAGAGGGGPLGSALSSLFSSAGSGVGQAAGAASFFPGFARGGMIYGPGHGTSDSIVARVSAGEFIVNAAATRANSNLLHAINTTGMPRFAEGGIVGGAVPAPANDAVGGDTHYHIDARGSTLTHDEMRSALTQAIAANNQRLPSLLADHQKRFG